MIPVILAGGTGTRLWPVSRQRQPKQGQALMDADSMVQKTLQRLRRGWPESKIFVSTNAEQYPLLRKQLRTISSRQFILEPKRMDTAAAIGLVATTLWKRNPKALMFTASSDHYFKEIPEYIRSVKTIGRVLQKYPDRTVLLGIKPSFAHTGLGYIKMRRQVDQFGAGEVFSVERFIEKPSQPVANKIVKEWQYLWNIGVFSFRVDMMLEKYRRWLPKSFALLMRMAKDMGTSRETATIKRLFPKMDKISIDYGVMEHDRNMLVLPADLTWADIGSWREVYDMLVREAGANVVRGHHVNRDSHGNLIYGTEKKIIATAGIRDLVIIDTPDALLICPRHRAQDVKHLVQELERQGLTQFL